MSSFPASNFGLGISPQVWLFSDFEGYNLLRQIGYPAYLTMQQQARLERIRQARLLHDGRHWRLFLHEGRTQFDFPQSNVNGVLKRMYVPYNLLKLIGQKSADLLFGDEPAVRVDDEIQQRKTAALVERTSLHTLLYSASQEAAVDAEAFVEAVVQDGAVYIKRIDAADIFPVGKIQPDGQYGSYVQYNAKNAGTGDKPDWKLLVTRYLPGMITRELKQLDQKGFILPKVLTLNQWPQEDPEQGPPEPMTPTGLDRPSVVWIPNLLVRDIAVSDYDGLIEQQDKLNANNTQIARVLMKHSDPKLAVPAEMATPDGALPANHDVFFFRDKDQIPQYLTWNAELANAMEDRKETRTALLTMAEMSPILLGIREGGGSSHNAFKSVRLEAINSLTKAQRKAVIWKAAVKRMIALAQDLEQTLPGERYDRKTVAVEMRDGLPADTDVRATELSTLRGCGLMSRERGVEILLQDPQAVEKELAALEEEDSQKTPSIFLQPPGTDVQENSPAGLAEEAAAETKAGEVEIAS